MTKNFLFPLFGFLFLLSSCDPNFIYNQKFEIPQETWTYTDTLDFSFNIPDTANIYNIYLEIDHSVEFPKQNLYVLIYTQFPSGERIREMVSLELCNQAGYWFGDCNSKTCSLNIPIQEGAYFNQKGDYRITLEQYSRKDKLEGIKSLALKIEETKNLR